jgi:predicted dienelactone hydrolase
MRLFEILMLAGSLLTLVLLATRRGRDWALGAGLVAAVLATVQLIAEGYRWQMLPAYASVAILLVAAVLMRRARSGWKWFALTSVLGLAAVALVIAAVLPLAVPMFAFPMPSGPHAIGTMTYHWVDETRADFGDPSAPRELMVQLWYPAEPGSDAPRDSYIQDDMHFSPRPGGGMPFPGFFFNHLNDIATHALVAAPVAAGSDRFPVLVFSPGATGFRQHNTFEVEELVSHGYVVAGIDHPRAAREVVFPDGRRIEYDPELIDVPRFLTDEAFGQARYNYLADDVSFVLDRIADLDAGDPTLAQRLDLEHVGMFGVSLGGLVTSEVCRKDARVKACLVEDVFVPQDAISAGADQPTMWITTDAASMRAQGWPEWEVALHQDTMRAAFEGARSDGYFVHVPGTFHLNYTDLPYTIAAPIGRALGLIGPIDWRRAHAIINAYGLAFFDRHLKSEAAPLLDGPSVDFPEAVIEARHP